MTNKIIQQEKKVAVLGVTGRAFAVVVNPDEYRNITSDRIVNQKMMFTRTKGSLKITVTMRFDDQCGNGHEDFSITGDTWELSGGKWREGSGGCIHDEIAKHFPEFKNLVKWNLTGTDGPMHYLANTLYHASNKDHNGLRKGERHQLRNGRTKLPVWNLVRSDGRKMYGLGDMVDAEVMPADVPVLKWEPFWIVGEGKDRELNAARRCAVWPDATDEELCSPDLEDKLKARLPALLAEFKRDMLAVGFLWPEGK